jgi:hypothetical protein
MADSHCMGPYAMVVAEIEVIPHVNFVATVDDGGTGTAMTPSPHVAIDRGVP